MNFNMDYVYMLGNDCKPLEGRDRSWLLAMLDVEYRSPKDWNKIMRLIRSKTVFSVVLVGDGLEKWARDGFFYDEKMNAYHVTMSIEALENLIKAKNLEGACEEYMVTATKFGNLIDTALDMRVNVAVDMYSHLAKNFLLYTYENGKLNAARTFDSRNRDELAQAAKKMAQGHSFFTS